MNITNLIYTRHNTDTSCTKMPTVAIPYYDLTLVLRGTLSYIINGESITLSAGDVLCLPSGTLRARDAGTERADYISFNFTPERAPRLPIRSERLVGSDVRLLIAAYDEFSKLPLVDSTKKTSYLLSCILLILEDKLVQKQYSPLTLKIIEYIHANLASKITLETIGEATFFSPVYCEGVFRCETGKPIIDYLIDARIAEAKKMLVGDVQSLVKVAEAVGFSDYNYFSRVFKKRTGYTPREYKRITALGE